jgi:hypothetical protein
MCAIVQTLVNLESETPGTLTIRARDTNGKGSAVIGLLIQKREAPIATINMIPRKPGKFYSYFFKNICASGEQI